MISISLKVHLPLAETLANKVRAADLQPASVGVRQNDLDKPNLQHHVERDVSQADEITPGKPEHDSAIHEN